MDLTQALVGIPIFALVMFLVFQISQVWVGPLVADTLVAWLETFQGWVGELMADASPLLSALVVDGMIGGVIAVIGFLPGLIAVVVMAAVITALCLRTQCSLGREYALGEVQG